MCMHAIANEMLIHVSAACALLPCCDAPFCSSGCCACNPNKRKSALMLYLSTALDHNVVAAQPSHACCCLQTVRPHAPAHAAGRMCGMLLKRYSLSACANEWLIKTLAITLPASTDIAARALLHAAGHAVSNPCMNKTCVLPHLANPGQAVGAALRAWHGARRLLRTPQGAGGYPTHPVPGGLGCRLLHAAACTLAA